MSLSKFHLLNKVKNRLFGRFPNLSFSRSGEDLIIEEFFRNKNSGFYVDIGAFHPVEFSNSYKYYLKGWRGINIDPNKSAIDLFEKRRPGDINICCAVGNEEGESAYHIFKDDESMNTISRDFLHSAQVKNNLIIKRIETVSVSKLSTILKKHLKTGTLIDFMSLDAEGMDLSILKSNDWSLFRPRIICVEVDCSISKIHENESVRFLEENDYVVNAYSYLTKNVGNAIFCDSLSQI